MPAPGPLGPGDSVAEKDHDCSVPDAGTYLTFCPALVKDPAMNVTESGENLPTQNRSMRAPEAGPGQEAQDLGAQGEL